MSINPIKLTAAATALLILSAGAAAAAPAIAEANVNVRAGPGTAYEVVGSLSAGMRVEVLDCTSSWCEVAFRGGNGFVSASYLDIGGSTGAAPPAVVYEEEEEYAPSYYGYQRYYYGPSVGVGVGIYGHRRGWHRHGGHRHGHWHGRGRVGGGDGRPVTPLSPQPIPQVSGRGSLSGGNVGVAPRDPIAGGGGVSIGGGAQGGGMVRGGGGGSVGGGSPGAGMSLSGR